MNRHNFVMVASSPHRNKYQGAAGSLNSVNPNLVVDTLTVQNTLTVNNLIITGSTGLDFTSLRVDQMTGGTGVFNNVYVTGIATVQNITINGTLTYTGSITTGFDSLVVSNANFTNMSTNNLTGTNLFITGTGNMSNVNSITLNLGTGTFSFAGSTNDTSTNAFITTLTGTNLIVNRLTITGASSQMILSTGGGNLNWYEFGTFSVTGVGACTGTYTGVNFLKTGNLVSIQFPTISDTVSSAGSTWTFAGIPTKVRPTTSLRYNPLAVSNSLPNYSVFTINLDGTTTLQSTIFGAGFTTAGTLYGNVVNYINS